MRILVTGAASQIGHFLVPGLVAEGHECICVSRRAHDDSPGVHWLQDDLRYPVTAFSAQASYDAWVNLAALEFVPPLLERAMEAGVRRLIAFGTTSIFTKRDAGTPHEKAFIRRIMDAETEVAEAGRRRDLDWTIFRPTLIYSGMDRNITFITRFVRRFRVFPLLGNGKRQPVHAEDLAWACIQVLPMHETAGRVYNLGGGEVLPYMEMIQRIFVALDIRPRFVRIPIGAARQGIALLSRFPGYGHLTTEMINRTLNDMVFDISEAQRDFAFEPRPFSLPPCLLKDRRAG